MMTHDKGIENLTLDVFIMFKSSYVVMAKSA